MYHTSAKGKQKRCEIYTVVECQLQLIKGKNKKGGVRDTGNNWPQPAHKNTNRITLRQKRLPEVTLNQEETETLELEE